MESREILHQIKFPGGVFSLKGDIDLPTKSSDLTPLDFLYGSFLKEKVCVNKWSTIPELEEHIRYLLK